MGVRSSGNMNREVVSKKACRQNGEAMKWCNDEEARAMFVTSQSLAAAVKTHSDSAQRRRGSGTAAQRRSEIAAKR